MNSKEKVLINKGIDCVRRGKFENALTYYDRAIEINPENVLAWNDKGVALFKLERDDEALEAYARALQIEPTNLDAIRNTGFVLRAQGKFEEAIKWYDRAIASGGDVGDMEGKATALVGLGRLEEALDLLLEAASIKPNQRLESEIEALSRALQLKPEPEDEEMPGEPEQP
jgi:tetratricopeptide (TPR) repeat protein